LAKISSKYASMASNEDDLEIIDEEIIKKVRAR
jgi:hypothetical protein